MRDVAAHRWQGYFCTYKYFFLPQDSCPTLSASFGPILEARQTSGQAGPVLQGGSEKISLRKRGWGFHLPGSWGRRSWAWSSRAPGGQQLCLLPAQWCHLLTLQVTKVLLEWVFSCAYREVLNLLLRSCYVRMCSQSRIEREKGEKGLFFVVRFWPFGAISFLLWVLVLRENSYVSW